MVIYYSAWVFFEHLKNLLQMYVAKSDCEQAVAKLSNILAVTNSL